MIITSLGCHCARLDVSIAVNIETKKRGRGIEQFGNYIHIICGVRNDQRDDKGLSIFIDR